MPVSPASSDRARRLDEALDAERARGGADRNRDAADQQMPDNRERLRTPGTNPGRVEAPR
jgi:hypothetical protein